MAHLSRRNVRVAKCHLLSGAHVDPMVGTPPLRMTVADLVARLIQMHDLIPSAGVTDQMLHVTLAKLVGLRDDRTVQALGTLHFAGVLSSETTVRLAISHERQQRHQVHKLRFSYRHKLR